MGLMLSSDPMFCNTKTIPSVALCYKSGAKLFTFQMIKRHVNKNLLIILELLSIKEM